MDYFKKLLDLLKGEHEEDRIQYQNLTQSTRIAERRTQLSLTLATPFYQSARRHWLKFIGVNGILGLTKPSSF